MPLKIRLKSDGWNEYKPSKVKMKILIRVRRWQKKWTQSQRWGIDDSEVVGCGGL